MREMTLSAIARALDRPAIRDDKGRKMIPYRE
jgi:hypothetical protein